MSTFQVPQFIDQKPKIIGPLTILQFFYVAVAGGISIACFYIFNFFLWILVSVVVLGIAVTLAFGKINGQEIPRVIVSGIKFLIMPRVYTWQRSYEKTSFSMDDFEKISEFRKKMTVGEKIKLIALSVTTGKILSPSQIRRQKRAEGYAVAAFSTGERRAVKKVDY